jgi:tetratricopeptide (TPR) repeat protein
MLYFFALHHASANDTTKYLESLDQAIAADPTDADVLIALYRLPNADAARRQKTLALIRAATEVFRKQIVAEPDDATGYNQLAWLVSNTEGDQDEALRSSLRSLELLPGAAGYMDTLGRCYYAQGDYEKAVYHQTRAVEIEQHSSQMKRQLELFREALARKKGESRP